jgi:dinuclear metal center YbgI/SA1388 family protein
VASRDEIIAFANSELRLLDYRDYGPMGLQHAGAERVTGIATAVSVNIDVIERAAEAGANMLIVHHGTFWNNESRILDERVGGRLRALQGQEMTLLAYHLCLDAHQKIGNNILAARSLGLGHLTPWEGIGWSGQYRTPMTMKNFENKVFKKFGQFPTVFWCHPSHEVHKCAVIVGGAAQYVVQAHRDGFDTFFTGELSEPSLHIAQDLKMNLIGAGHDRTERSGVQTLGAILSRKFGLPHIFIDSPNPI